MRIIKVERIEHKDAHVYDLHIQDNHNYTLSCGMIAHNSGKGASLDYLIDINGKTLDVDALKVAALKMPKIKEELRSRFGNSVDDPDFLRNPENVSKIHLFLNDEKMIPDKREAALFASILTAPADRKPNLIFDITLKDLNKIVNWGDRFKMLGYDKKKIHIVWVLNSFEVARTQNLNRSRVVSDGILFATHAGASMSMEAILSGAFNLRDFADGYVFINFNQAKVDNKLVKSGAGGAYMETANYIKVKEPGKSINKEAITKDVIAKIKSYVPNGKIWEEVYLDEATHRTKEEERVFAKGHPLFTKMSFNGWSLTPMAHVAAQAKDRFPSASNGDWVKFIQDVIKRLDTFVRDNTGEREIPFSSRSKKFKVIFNVDFEQKQLRGITTLSDSMASKSATGQPMRAVTVESLSELEFIEVD